jgi:hypothetical protein
MRVGTRHRGIFEYIEQRVVFPFHKRSVHGNVAGGNAERSFHFIGRNLEDFSEFFRTGFAFVSLLEFGEGFIDFVERTDLVEGKAHDTALFGECLQDTARRIHHTA